MSQQGQNHADHEKPLWTKGYPLLCQVKALSQDTVDSLWLMLQPGRGQASSGTTHPPTPVFLQLSHSRPKYS